MLKKILVSFILIVSSLLIFNNNVVANSGETMKERCSKSGATMLNCKQFRIDVSNFSPGNKNTLDVAKAGNGDTKETANAILGVIIRNMIIIFGVLSLFVMTIGGGFMIFHAGDETYLTRGKLMLKYGIVSLAIALASGVIVKIVNWLLY